MFAKLPLPFCQPPTHSLHLLKEPTAVLKMMRLLTQTKFCTYLNFFTPIYSRPSPAYTIFLVEQQCFIYKYNNTSIPLSPSPSSTFIRYSKRVSVLLVFSTGTPSDHYLANSKTFKKFEIMFVAIICHGTIIKLEF